MSDLLRKLTVEQWRAIDEEYVDPAAPRQHAAGLLLAVALSLILSKYWGRPSTLLSIEGAAAFVATLPQPALYPHLYWALFKVVNYFIVPALYVKLVLKQRIVDNGLGPGVHKGAWKLYFAMLAFVVVLVYGASFHESFLRTYPKYKGLASSLWGFAVWELAYGVQFFLLELFFRGFFIFVLARHIGSLAIFVMVVPYTMVHFGKPPAECFASVLAGIILGTLALRTRSIYGGVMLHCGAAWSMDTFALLHKGQLGRLFGLD